MTTNLWVEQVIYQLTLCWTTPGSDDLIPRFAIVVTLSVMVRLQTALGTEGVRRRPDAARAIRSHLATGHRTVQQVCI